MNQLLFGSELQEICECAGRCWRIYDPEWDSETLMFTTYAFCPLCNSNTANFERYLVPITRYYRPWPNK
jgi:hypothetical protein